MVSYCCQKGCPVSHSHQLLNHIVDCVATRKPQALYAEYPKSITSYEAGFFKVTYSRLANAVNRIAWWLVNVLGPSQNFETLAYIGPNDLIYPALILGAVKTGYKTLLLSPRNNLAAQLHLLQVTECKVFLSPYPRPAAVSVIQKAVDETYRFLEVPSIEELLQPHCPNYAYTQSFEEAQHTPLTVMHTSGSTGLPKPIVWPQSFAAAYAKQLQLSPPDGFCSTDQLYRDNRIFVIFPPFHAAYIANALVNAITNQTAIVFPLKGTIPSVHSLSEIVRHTKVDAALVVPSVIEEMSKSPELLNHIATRVDTMVYSGGDVPQACGNIVAAEIPIVNFYGSTEGASLGLIHKDSELNGEEWKYLSFHPSAGTEFRHYAEGMHELYIVRNLELEAHQQIFTAFPDLHEFRTRDLFRKHPTKPHLWSHCGRADDIIVFLTGEKVNPVGMEQYIFSQNSEISGVLVAGSQRFQAALVIELVEKESISLGAKAELIENFWPSIEYANTDCPAHARIAKSHIVFVDSDRPMTRSSKGTIQRAATIAEYTKDLDTLYQAADELDGTTEATATCSLHDTESTILFLKSLILKICGQSLEGGDNFFMQGMDSLQALLLTREMRLAFSLPRLDVSMTYTHPTMLSLVDALQQVAKGGKASEHPRSSINANNVDNMLSYHCGLIDSIPVGESGRRDESSPSVVLLSGSTGSLGSYVLDSFICSRVSHIYCLNRSSGGRSLQTKRNHSRGLRTEFADSQVTFLAVDFAKPSFGLDSGVYSKLLSEVTTIIHNAWPVDFNFPLSSYGPQLRGIVNLVDFAATAQQAPQLLYISSVSAVSNFQCLPIPEMVVDDSSAPAPMGYGQSKYIAENLISHAAQRLPIKAQIARVGQIAGPTCGPGLWNRSEWLPRMLRSSLDVSVIPQSLGSYLDRVDWIPIDKVAAVLIDLLEGAEVELHQTRGSVNGLSKQHAAVFNIVNPNTRQWQSLLPTITALLPLLNYRDCRAEIDIVSFEEWIRRVRDRFETHSKAPEANNQTMEVLLETNPAAKLLGFYEEVAAQKQRSWLSDRAQQASQTLRSLGEIQDEWMEKWIRGWMG